MDTKKLAATFAILMIALSVAGFAYAHWEKIVTVDGTVTTGTLHVIPSFYMTMYQDKPVASYGYTVDEAKNYIEVWIDNVYPCLRADGWIDLENTGTIPVHLVDCKITGTEGVYAVWNEEMGYWEIYQTVPGGDPLLIATGNYTYNFPNATPNDPTQIDPEGTAYIYFWIHFEEGLPKDSSYWFHIEFLFWNWNEK